MGSYGWRILVCQNRKMRFSARSEYAATVPILSKQGPYFSSLVWAATAGKIGFRRQRLDKQKDPSLSK